MKVQRNGLVRYILILILILALVRFFPVLMRATQAITIGARGYWWAILPILVVSGIIWRMMRRGSVAKKSEYQFESPRFRDVTDSSEGRSE